MQEIPLSSPDGTSQKAQSAAFERLLREINAKLRTIEATAAIREDEEASELYAQLARANGMEELHRVVLRLGERVDDMVSERTGVSPRARALLRHIVPRHVSQTEFGEAVDPRPAAATSASSLAAEEAQRDSGRAPRGRTFLKL